MNQLLKLHLGLIKYLKTELKKKRTLKELILFIKQIGKIYLQQLLKFYKNLFLVFNPKFQEQKKQYNNYQKIKKELQQALKLLKYIDTKMGKQGINRQRRRQFWRDFFKDGQVRNEVFEQLLKEINQIGG